MADLEETPDETGTSVASTIYDVSALAGVSTSTVSRTFSRPEMISEATRNKVLTAAKKLGYRPNTLAGALTTKRTLLIGLLTSDIQNPFVASLARGVQDGIAAKRYLSIICSTDGDAVRELDLLEEMLARGIDGFILTPPFDGPDPSVVALLKTLPKRNVPVVFIGHQSKDSSNDFATSGAESGALEAVNHLIALGHTRIGFIGGSYTRGIGLGRWRGYREALHLHALPPHHELERETNATSKGGFAAMEELLNLSKPPSAVVAINDLVAIGAMDACKEREIAVPSQMSIIGFDDIPVASLTTPPLTTVAQPAYELGHTAANLILNRIATPHIAPQRITLGCRFIMRGTTARYKTPR